MGHLRASQPHGARIGRLTDRSRVGVFPAVTAIFLTKIVKLQIFKYATNPPLGRFLHRGKTEENPMRKLVFALAAVATLGLAAPANAQVSFGAGPGGVAVGIGDGGWRHDGWRGHRFGGAYAYDRDWDGPRYGAYGGCRVVKVRRMLPDGSVVIRTRQFC
jgi:hypothetical protein